MSVCYLARTGAKLPKIQAGDDAGHVAWHDLQSLPELAFDHAMLIERARVCLANRAE